MNRYPKAHLIPVLIATLLTSCVTNKPRENGVSLVDNDRGYYKVTEPYYRKKTNGLGYVFTISFMGGGAYLGYTYKPEAATNTKYLYAAGGAAGGFLLSKLFLLIGGSGKKVNLNKPEEIPQWLSDYNKAKKIDWLATPNPIPNLDSFWVLPRSKEQSFIPHYLYDVKNFNSLFPQSSHFNNVIDSINKKLTKTELSELIDLFPMQESIIFSKVQYVNKSQNEQEFGNAIKKYPETKDFVEATYASLIITYPFAIDFINKYPNSKYADKIFTNVFVRANHSGLGMLLNAYPTSVRDLNIARTLYYERCISVEELLTSIKKFNDQNFVIKPEYNYESFENAENFYTTLKDYTPKNDENNIDGLIEDLKFRFLSQEKTAVENNVEETKALFETIKANKWLRGIKADTVIDAIILQNCKLFGEDYFTGKKGSNGYEGEGKLYRANGDIQNGTFSSGKLNGKGIVIKQEGDVLEGFFENGELNGEGVINEPEGRKISGSFIKGDLNGKGKITFSDGSYQEGSYRLNRLSGYGEWHFINGNYYQGEFSDGKFNGKGKYYWKNAELRFEGRFDNGKRNGIGQLYMPDGYSAQGVWLEDCADGEISVYKTDTDKLIGRINTKDCIVLTKEIDAPYEFNNEKFLTTKVSN